MINFNKTTNIWEWIEYFKATRAGARTTTAARGSVRAGRWRPSVLLRAGCSSGRRRGLGRAGQRRCMARAGRHVLSVVASAVQSGLSSHVKGRTAWPCPLGRRPLLAISLGGFFVFRHAPRCSSAFMWLWVWASGLSSFILFYLREKRTNEKATKGVCLKYHISHLSQAMDITIGQSVYLHELRWTLLPSAFISPTIASVLFMLDCLFDHSITGPVRVFLSWLIQALLFLWSGILKYQRYIIWFHAGLLSAFMLDYLHWTAL
jgi:hypothetical protein